MASLASVKELLSRYDQRHLLASYEELPPRRQQHLLDQVASIDFPRLDALIRTHVLASPSVHIPADLQPAPIRPASPADEETRSAYAEARRTGERLIADGKAAAMVVAGGAGTRLGFDGPKGCLAVTPVKHKSLFQVFAEQLLATGRRYGAAVPWYVMTSPDNDADTRRFFADHDLFGLSPDDVFFLVQGQLPAVATDGKILLAERDEIAWSPDGHGGSLSALRNSGALDDMARRGVEHISYFQVDNPLVRCMDPLFIGLHAAAGAGMSAKARPKREPTERVGNFCMVDGKVTVIEYSDLPDELARATTPDGRLRFNAGSIAIHVLSRRLVEHLTEGGSCRLPFHRAEKAVPYVDPAGNKVTPETPNAVKLEMFIFDAMPLAETTVVLETVRSQEFSPIKNASGPDSVATALHDQIRRAADWLKAAGISVPRDARGEFAAAVEISPLLAMEPGDLIGKVDPDMTIRPEQEVYLS
ncbi:MAG: UTP--glucose-1-phosphate uridylyltransferase [Planctomycetota bacterium]|jgi:UDP-N-acetylglucosamine/UDP-N-acetylgalactosamine diphosphorylase